MQKIFVDKKETTAEIIKHLKTANDSVVMLVVPTDSKLKTVTNFRSLKKNSVALGKNIIIESVDEKVLSLANAAQLEALHPFLSSRMSKSLADIIVAPKVKNEVLPKSRKKAHVLKVKGSGDKAVPIPLKKGWEVKVPISWKKIYIPLALFSLIVLGGLVVNAFFTKAEITINFQRTPWEMEHVFTASTSLPRDGAAGYMIPGQLLKQEKSLAQLFPGSGRSTVSQKATGKISVYNAYSADPQRLVKTTRFVTPDGKVFRLDSDIVVPGETSQDGKLVPSSIKTTVTADQPGPAYNIGPVQRLSVPGFQGTPKYQGFYGVMDEGAAGGFIGEKNVATDQDILTAKEKATEILRAAFQNTFLSSPPQGLKIIDGASELRISRMNVDRVTNSDGNFTVFGEAEFRSLAFREDDLKNLIQNRAFSENPGSKFESFSLAYKDVRPNFETGELVFNVEASGVLVPDFDSDGFKSQVLGRSEKDVHTLVLSLPNLKDAKISVLPFWVRRIPENKDRVKVNVQ